MVISKVTIGKYFVKKKFTSGNISLDLRKNHVIISCRERGGLVDVDPKLIAKRIRTKRTELGLTQKDLAEQVGVTPPAINRFEKGEKSPSVDTLLKLAKALGVSTDFLLGAESGEDIFIDKDVSEAFKDFKSLSLEHRQMVLANIKFFKTQDK